MKLTAMLRLLITALFAVTCFVATSSFAQLSNAAPSSPTSATTMPTTQAAPTGGDSGEAPLDFTRILTRFEFWLSLIILAFGAIVVAVQYALLRKRSFDGNDILRVFGVTLIVVGTLFLITAGFGDKQIAPAMGLFGTLAGYLLGKASREPGSKTGGNAQD